MPTRPVIDPDTHETCALCGDDREEEHHIDGDRANDSPKNLLPVCSSCHNGIHHGREAQYLPWFYQLKSSARHSALPRVGRRTELQKQTRARLMHQRLTEAFTAAQTVFEEASDTGHYLNLALGVQRESFFYDFKLLPVSKKWAEGRYEFRPLPIVLEETDHHGYVVRLRPFDAPDDVGPTQSAYVEFADVINTGTPYTVGPLTLPDGQSLPQESTLQRDAVDTRS